MNTLSWHLNKNINNVKNLFSQIDLPYELDCFVCSCGHNEIIIKDQYTILENYSCKHCDNKDCSLVTISMLLMAQYNPIAKLQTIGRPFNALAHII